MQSNESKRGAIRKALARQPDNLRLRHLHDQLTGPRHVQMAMGNGIFINYARPDELFALELAENLRQRDVNVWLDMLNIERGADWHNEVRLAMKRCDLMLAVLSPAALRDAEAIRERMHFYYRGKMVLPVIRRSCDLSNVDFGLDPIDFSRDFNRGFYALRRVLEAPARA